MHRVRTNELAVKQNALISHRFQNRSSAEAKLPLPVYPTEPVTEVAPASFTSVPFASDAFTADEPFSAARTASLTLTLTGPPGPMSSG